MKKTLNADEVNKIVADTIDKMEARKGTTAAPYVQMDLSIYTSDTLEAIKEAFVASGIRFEDRWGNGSDFVVPIDVKTAPPIFRSGRRDAFTKSNGPICEPGQAKKPLNMGRRDAFTKHDGPICEPGQAKKPLNMGRRDVGTVDPRNPMHESVHQVKKPSLEEQINAAEKLVKEGTPKKTPERTL